MDVTAHADITVVALQQVDELALLLELTAPPAPPSAEPRRPAVVQVVLDRSGSMAGERLEAAKRALDALVVRLDPADHLGVVAFDDAVELVLPAGPLTDKAAARAAIAQVGPGGMTNLSAGWLRGVQEARRAAEATGGRATLVLLSDGHANAGLLDPAQLDAAAAGAARAGVTTATIGVGLDYDEAVLSALARGGTGDHVFAEGPEDAASGLAGLIDGLLATTVSAASLRITTKGAVASITLFNDLPVTAVADGLVVELGDLHASEQRKLALTLGVPAATGLGLAQVAELELRWVELPALVERTHVLPVTVNVVPGDQAAGRIRDPRVRTELEYLKVQKAKRRAGEQLRRGEGDAAARTLQDAGDALSQAIPSAPPAAREELHSELGELSDLVLRMSYDDDRRTAKRAEMLSAQLARKRGRMRRDG